MGKGSSKLQNTPNDQPKIKNKNSNLQSKEIKSKNNKNNNFNLNEGKNNKSNNNNFTYDGIKYDYIDICSLLTELSDAVITNIDLYNNCKNNPDECKNIENIISEIIGNVYDITELISNICTYIVSAKVYKFDDKVVNCIAYHFWFVFSLVILHDNNIILKDNFFKLKNNNSGEEKSPIIDNYTGTQNQKNSHDILYVDYHTLKYKITDTFTCFIYMHNKCDKSVKDIFNENKVNILQFWADKLSEKNKKYIQTIFDKFNKNSNNRWSNSSQAELNKN